MNDDNTAEQLESLPCPFCGSSDISDGEVLIENSEGRIAKQSECQDCGALGPYAFVDGPDYGGVLAITAWNTRADQGGEAVAWLVESEKAGRVSSELHELSADKVIAEVVHEYGDAYGATTKRPLYTHPPRATADEDAGQMLPKGWTIEVRTSNDRHALCIFGPDGCFAIHGETDHKSDLRHEVINQLHAALAGKRGE